MILQGLTTEQQLSRVNKKLKQLAEKHKDMFSTNLDILDQVSQRTAEMITQHIISKTMPDDDDE